MIELVPAERFEGPLGTWYLRNSASRGSWTRQYRPGKQVGHAPSFKTAYSYRSLKDQIQEAYPDVTDTVLMLPFPRAERAAPRPQPPLVSLPPLHGGQSGPENGAIEQRRARGATHAVRGVVADEVEDDAEDNDSLQDLLLSLADPPTARPYVAWASDPTTSDVSLDDILSSSLQENDGDTTASSTAGEGETRALQSCVAQQDVQKVELRQSRRCIHPQVRSNETGLELSLIPGGCDALQKSFLDCADSLFGPGWKMSKREWVSNPNNSVIALYTESGLGYKIVVAGACYRMFSDVCYVALLCTRIQYRTHPESTVRYNCARRVIGHLSHVAQGRPLVLLSDPNRYGSDRSATEGYKHIAERLHMTITDGGALLQTVHERCAQFRIAELLHFCDPLCLAPYGARQLPPLPTSVPVTPATVEMACAPSAASTSISTVGDGVAVRKSTVQHAGNGLFATRPFSRGETITEYSGTRLAGKLDAAHLPVQTHIIRRPHPSLGNDVYIDGIRHQVRGRGGGSFANHRVNPNAEAVVDGEGRIVLRCVAAISPEDEIFLNYGKGIDVAFGTHRLFVVQDVDGRETTVKRAVAEGPAKKRRPDPRSADGDHVCQVLAGGDTCLHKSFLDLTTRLLGDGWTRSKREWVFDPLNTVVIVHVENEFGNAIAVAGACARMCPDFVYVSLMHSREGHGRLRTLVLDAIKEQAAGRPIAMISDEASAEETAELAIASGLSVSDGAALIERVASSFPQFRVCDMLPRMCRSLCLS